MKNQVLYFGLNGLEAIKDRKTKKIVYFGKKSKLTKPKVYLKIKA